MSFSCAPLGVGYSRQVLGVNPPGYLDVNQEEDDVFMVIQPDLHPCVWSLQVSVWPWEAPVMILIFFREKRPNSFS